METDPLELGGEPSLSSRFELAAPRRFLLPALLLLIAEEPRHGYQLAKDLHELHVGRVDRPGVYRALGQLERDGLATSVATRPGAAQSRRSYTITESGQRALRQWMGVVKEERDGLDRVLRRYVGSDVLDARLAEVAGGWQRVTVPVFSTVAPSTRGDTTIRSMHPISAVRDAATSPTARKRHYDVRPDRSVVLVDARSSVGPITFGALGLTGTIDALTDGGHIRPDADAGAHLEVRVDQLRSGNGLYDAELLRRIEGNRYPTVVLDLRDCKVAGAGNRVQVRGDVTCHGTTRSLDGSIEIVERGPGSIVIRGEQTLDIRDFGVSSPNVLMLRIYPDVVVKIQIEAELRDEEV